MVERTAHPGDVARGLVHQYLGWHKEVYLALLERVAAGREES